MTYPGGKNGSGVYQAIINQMPPHRIYVEPFLGSGAVMRMKRPAAVNVGIDADANCIRNFDISAVPGVHLVHGDVFASFAPYSSPDALIYLDPPYLPSTRTHKKIYAHEFDEVQHRRLLAAIVKLRCMVMISGYWSRLYARELKGWRLIRFTAATRGGPRTECLWMNFPVPAALHDVRYLGTDYRERENIKRQVTRWRTRFAALPPLKRQAIASALAMVESSTGDRAGVRSP